MRYTVQHTWIHMSGGLDGAYPHIMRCEHRRYEDGTESVVKGKPLFILKSMDADQLMPMFKIANEAMEHLGSFAPKVKQ